MRRIEEQAAEAANRQDFCGWSSAVEAATAYSHGFKDALSAPMNTRELPDVDIENWFCESTRDGLVYLTTYLGAFRLEVSYLREPDYENRWRHEAIERLKRMLKAAALDIVRFL